MSGRKANALKTKPTAMTWLQSGNATVGHAPDHSNYLRDADDWIRWIREQVDRGARDFAINMDTRPWTPR
jgi:hypothetical protein